MKHWLNRGYAVLGLGAMLVSPVLASYIQYEKLQSGDADPSPSARRSHIDNYEHQDEQINLDAGSGQVRVLRANQKNLVNDYVTKVIVIHNAPVREISHVVRRMTKLEGGDAESVINSTTHENGVQVTAPAYMIPYLEDAVANLDVPWLKEYWDGAADSYIKMQHREAFLVDLIASNYAGTEGFTTVDSTNNALHRFDEPYRQEQYAKAVKLVDIPPNEVELEVKIYEVASTNDLKLGTDYISWKNGPGRNLFSFMTAGYSDHQRARGLTSVFDPFINAYVPIATSNKIKVADFDGRESYRSLDFLLTSAYVDFLQVKGQARVINEQKLMLLSASTGSIRNLDQVTAITNNLNDVDTVSPGLNPSIIGRTNAGSLPVANTGFGGEDAASVAPNVTYIDRNGNGSLDHGEVALAFDGSGFTWFVDDNGNGLLEAGERVISEGEAFPSAPGSASTPIQDFGRELDYTNVGQTGMSLRLTPYVGLESCELEINLQLSDLNGTAPSGIPIINARTVRTTVRLLDGQPFVMAGLTRKHNLKNSEKAPWIGSIPVLGYLFGGETDAKRDNDVVVVITPRFHLANEVNLMTPARVNTLDLMINKPDCCPQQGTPKLTFGYDQWLLDKQS